MQIGTIDYETGFSKPKYLCRWWARSRKIPQEYSPYGSVTTIDGVEVSLPMYEFYIPWWAKPLDFIWQLIFGKPTLGKL